MASEASARGEIVTKYRVHEKDTGSPEVQIALLTGRLEELAKHFEANPKDHHSRRGMLRMVSRRKRLLDYLRSESGERYQKLIASLGLRK
ncbi:MAG: 30S ribosomal protein S15 [Bdellovibrionota bacterium]|nr:MAG: 30S ribosomal protein S15 [Bdellovibrionota bacterium]